MRVTDQILGRRQRFVRRERHAAAKNRSRSGASAPIFSADLKTAERRPKLPSSEPDPKREVETG